MIKTSFVVVASDCRCSASGAAAAAAVCVCVCVCVRERGETCVCVYLRCACFAAHDSFFFESDPVSLRERAAKCSYGCRGCHSLRYWIYG